MKRALALSLCVALPVFAQPKTHDDAPVKVQSAQLVPFDGILDTEEHFLASEKKHAGDDAKIAELTKALPVVSPMVVAIIVAVASVGLGFGIGFGVAKATTPMPAP